MSGPLDCINILEVKKIREILTDQPDLLSVFEMLVKTNNVKINDEKVVRTMPIEIIIEPDLSSDSADDFFIEGN